MTILTQEEAHRLFEYKDGVLIRKVTTSRLGKQGDVAGWKSNTGYQNVLIRGKQYGVHQIVYLLHYGVIPKLIDHIDNNPQNNLIKNLREANKTENNLNAKTRTDNTSGCKNVNWHSQKRKWQVRLCINKKSVSFGLYNDLEFADLVAQEARNKYFGSFARHS
jgi:hypothetical protein